jgi:uncharacterized protein (TIGR00725 family)
MIAVVGPGDCDDAALLAVAAEVGRLIALAGHDLVTGGLGGVMAAAARGASQAGGRVVGLLPGNDPAAANDWVDVAIPTGLGQGRNLLVVRAAAVVVAVGGSWGTLAEIALARRAGTPVVSLNGWVVHGPPADDIVVVDTAEDAVRAAACLLSSPPS